MMIEQIVNHIFKAPVEMIGNKRNVYFEGFERCCLRVKIFFGMFCLPPMEKQQKLAII
jgi:hypothetical protein